MNSPHWKENRASLSSKVKESFGSLTGMAMFLTWSVVVLLVGIMFGRNQMYNQAKSNKAIASKHYQTLGLTFEIWPNGKAVTKYFLKTQGESNGRQEQRTTRKSGKN